jgi:DNA-binding MarR family transcriptional regulator
MDYLRTLDSLALASRLRRVLDEIQRQGKSVYAELGIDFRTRWFSVFHFVANNPDSSITQIAGSLNLRHPSVIQAINEMIDKGLLRAQLDAKDRRFRRISLTPRGQRLLTKLKPVWSAFKAAGWEILGELDNHLLRALDDFESALDRSSLRDRIIRILRSTERSK